jgi:hypothetical protein
MIFFEMKEKTVPTGPILENLKGRNSFMCLMILILTCQIKHFSQPEKFMNREPFWISTGKQETFWYLAIGAAERYGSGTIQPTRHL